MKFYFYFFNSSALHLAIKKQNIEIIKMLLSNKDIDVNAIYV